jgi:predicted RNA-binding Zn-ribbon protein involved in translation (DUF1610 family)
MTDDEHTLDEEDMAMMDEHGVEEDDTGIFITKLSPALIHAAEFMPATVAADTVRVYYSAQEQRLKIDNQIRATRLMACPECGEKLNDSRKGQPVTRRTFVCKECGHEGQDEIDATAPLFVREALAVGEERAKNLLDRWTANDVLATWSREVMGIGPVLAAGLRAEIDVARAPHVSSVWRFAGYDPTAVWLKGQKRPHNAFLKVICWKIGDSFVKVSGREKSIYGHLYRIEKTRLEEKNANGGFAEDAAARLAGDRPPGPSTEAYKALKKGLLPKGQIDLRARRKAVKIFLSHYWVQGRMLADLPVSAPYAIEKLGHTHTIEPEVPYITL